MEYFSVVKEHTLNEALLHQSSTPILHIYTKEVE